MNSLTETARPPAPGRQPAPPRPFAGVGETSRWSLLQAPLRWPEPGRLEASVRTLAGAGPKLSQAAAEAGIATLGDLLLHVPHSYRDLSEVKPLA
jgi:hypothetical protein